MQKEDKTEYSWHLKEKYQGCEYSIHLYYVAFPYIQLVYHSLGLLRYICVMSGTEIVYAQVKKAKTFAKI